MNKTWRPDGWQTPHFGDGWMMDSIKYVTYEQGADAMYEPAYQKGRKDERDALREKGVHNRMAIKPGVHVFIPDDPPEFKAIINKRDIYYELLWQSHPATKVIESGYFCPWCGTPVTYHTYHYCDDDNRAIRY